MDVTRPLHVAQKAKSTWDGLRLAYKRDPVPMNGAERKTFLMSRCHGLGGMGCTMHGPITDAFAFHNCFHPVQWLL